MKPFILSIFCCILFFISSCVSSNTESEEKKINPVDSMTNIAITDTIVEQKITCELEGEAIPENKFLLKDINRLVALTTSENNISGWLEVYNTENCEQINKIDLPTNNEEDYPYYLAQIMYNKDSKVIGIRGFDKICLFDVMQNQLSKPLAPKYLKERAMNDASAPKILRLEVWEDYLIGYTEGNGAFVFDLENPIEPVPVLPMADFSRTDDTYSSLFLLPNKNNNTNYHVLFPQYDYENNTFEMRSLFDKPQPLMDEMNDTFRNNRFVVLRENSEGRTPCVIDMLEQKKVKLPADIMKLKNKQILHWVKENV